MSTKEEVKVLEDEIASLKNYIAELEKKLADASEKLAAAEKAAKGGETADKVELAVVFSGDKIPVEMLLGKGYKSSEDADGFTRVWVSKLDARRLLVSDSVTKFYLVGGADSLAAFRSRGLHSEPVTVFRHEYKDGKWVSTEPKPEEVK